MNNQSPKGNRIAKVLSRSGVASRRDAEKIILKGRVKVNGEILTSPAGEVSISPFTFTRPFKIIFSASRRLATPERERTLAIRLPLGD